MGDPSRLLVLGFIGGSPVHRDNARALLTDFINTHLRDNKGAQIKMILAVEPFSDTMEELADFCLTSGYTLGLVGHKDALEDPKLDPYREDARGNLVTLKEGRTIGGGLVSTIYIWKQDARLILLADPEEDDDTYVAVTSASGVDIPVRSLLLGLDRVILEPTDTKETDPMPTHDDYEDEEEYDEEDLDEDELDEDEEYEEDEELEDDEEDAVDAELIEEDEEEEEEDGEEEIADEEEYEEEAEEEDDDLDDEDAEEPEDEEPEDEEEEEMPTTKAPPTKTKKHTVASLTALVEKQGREAFYEIAAPFGVLPGKGQKIPNMINKVVAAQNGTAPAPAKKAPAKKVPAVKAPAKKAPAKAAAPAKKAPAKKAAPAPAPAAKKAAPAPKKAAPKTTMRPIRQAKAEDFIAVAESAIALAKTLL